jgi:hypothetical protein
MSKHPRVVIALPDAAERVSLANWLQTDGFEPVQRSSATAAAEEMRARAFDLLITDATFVRRDGLHAMGRRRHPSAPMVVLGSSAETGQPGAMYLSRPVERAMLMCAVSIALLDERPAQRSPRKIVNRFLAIANNVPSRILDVSKEGLRVEIPYGTRSVPPPYFNVRVPEMGVAITVRRKWVQPWPSNGRPQVLRCGVELSNNRATAEQAWRAFVDALPVIQDPSQAPILTFEP